MTIFFKRRTYKHFSQEELIQSAKNDDLQALEELIKREQRNVYASLYYMCDKSDDLLDHTQEILYKMTKGLKNLKSPKAFRSWLNQIIMHFCYDQLRKKSKKPKLVPIEKVADENAPHAAHAPELVDTKKKPDENSLLKELDEHIVEAVGNLPENLKLAVVLREFQGLSYEEISSLTNSNVGTVKSRISRARNKLQEDLKHYIS